MTTSDSGGTEFSEKLLTKPEVARFLQCSTRSVDLWMKDGRLPYFKIGRTVRFALSDVISHLEVNFRTIRRRLPATPINRFSKSITRTPPGSCHTEDQPAGLKQGVRGSTG